MPILICQQCDRMFEVAPSREHSARYCSKECQLAATQKKEAKFAPASVPAQRKAA